MKKKETTGMADFAIAFKKLETFEDSPLHSGIVTTDEGGRTRFGVAEKFHPELTASGFYDEAKMPHDEALKVAATVAHDKYWKPIHGDKLTQPVADKLLDIAYNCGVDNTAHIAQNACQSLGARITVDNVIGDLTVAAINSLDELKFLALVRQLQLRHYMHIREVRPVSPNEWVSWMRRTAS